MTLDLVIAGNLLVDDLVFPDGKTRMGEPGGAVLYAALAASLWGARVGCASVCGQDYPELARQALAGRGVNLEGVHPLGRAGVRTWLIYEEAGRRMVPRLGGPGHAAMCPTPEQLPASYWEARAYHLAPMPLACQQALAAELHRRQAPLITLDPHLPIREDTLAAWRPVLACVDAIFPAREELQLDGLEDGGDPGPALQRLGGGRLRYIVLKRGEHGGQLYDLRTQELLAWPARAPLPVDPTGAGDAFAAGFVTALLEGHSAAAALPRALVSASFALAGWGAIGLLAATQHAARQRLKEWTVSAPQIP